MINRAAIQVLWMREMKRFLRAKSRIVGALAMPLFFLAFLGMGFRRISVPGMTEQVDYIRFLVPGILGMSLLFSSTFGGLSVLWDREFGFLKEIMVAPVTRVSIVLGRIAGGVTTALIQGLLILGIATLIGFRMNSILYGADFGRLSRPRADFRLENEGYAGLFNCHEFCHLSPVFSVRCPLSLR